MKNKRKEQPVSARSSAFSSHLCLVAVFPILILCFFQRPLLAKENASVSQGSTDRWIEMDLYWFRQQDIQGSVQQLFDRYTPLFRGVGGYCGINLNISWTVSTVMEWNGNLHQRITLPKRAQSKWVDERGQLTGTSEEREQKAAARFALPAAVKDHAPDPWTYEDLKRLVAALKQEAARRGIRNFHVGMINLGWNEVYGGKTLWASRHPEAFATSTWATPEAAFQLEQYFDPGAHLHRDPRPLGGLPHGIPEGMPVYEAYAAQWGSLSKAVGLDAILLRDSMGLPVVYQRGGPWGPVAPSPDIIRKATAGVAALVRYTKKANPNALVMMFSNGASSIGDWRANGTDVELIAKEGYLDIWIDQTYAGAWNEVGVRQNNFWNVPTQGWTYQLGYVLGHAALLADTRVRHYTVVDTFDAWEDWDTLHTAPERLRWGIWAFSHAAVKMPNGLKLPAGAYISWANQGGRLLSGQDVHFLTDNLNAAEADAHRTTQIFGPTMVYSRESMQWQVDHATPNHDIKEWIDEQAAAVSKWTIPISSITRMEWLPRVRSDLFLLQTPSHLSPKHTADLAHLIEAGKPIAIFGSPAGGIDPSLEALTGFGGRTLFGTAQIEKYKATTDSDTTIAKNTPPTFETYYRLTQNTAARGTSTLYSVQDSPALVLNTTNDKHVLLWDPPELRSTVNVPLSQTWGNHGAPYALAAGALNSLLQEEHALHAAEIDVRQTMSIAAWQTADGKLHILAGNLEEGLRDDADFTRHVALVLPESWKRTQWRDVWTGNSLAVSDDRLTIDLPQASSVLLESEQ